MFRCIFVDVSWEALQIPLCAPEVLPQPISSLFAFGVHAYGEALPIQWCIEEVLPVSI